MTDRPPIVSPKHLVTRHAFNCLFHIFYSYHVPLQNQLFRPQIRPKPFPVVPKSGDDDANGISPGHVVPCCHDNKRRWVRWRNHAEVTAQGETGNWARKRQQCIVRVSKDKVIGPRELANWNRVRFIYLGLKIGRNRPITCKGRRGVISFTSVTTFQ